MITLAAKGPKGAGRMRISRIVPHFEKTPAALGFVNPKLTVQGAGFRACPFSQEGALMWR